MDLAVALALDAAVALPAGALGAFAYLRMPMPRKGEKRTTGAPHEHSWVSHYGDGKGWECGICGERSTNPKGR